MISRRKLVTGSAALAAYAALDKRSRAQGVLPGSLPGGAVSAYRPASFGPSTGVGNLFADSVFDVTLSETKLAVSLWFKSSGFDFLWLTTAGGLTVVEFRQTNGDDLRSRGTADLVSYTYSEIAANQISTDSAWHHYVCLYDSTQATDDDRIRMYKDGSFLTDTDSIGKPALNENCGYLHGETDFAIGFSDDAGKYAFIDVVHGQDVAVTDFGFDDGGTWTRKRYAGAYGTYGYRLDGSNGYISTIGGYDFGQHASSPPPLDYDDLPPYTN